MAPFSSSILELYTSLGLVATASLAFITYTITLYAYRIYFSPLSHIPGPKLAAATRWYEFYYDAILVGKYYEQIEQMHKKYGPIVRITPYEVHINDPKYFNELYNVAKKLDKDPWYYSWLSRNGSIFATIDADHHKLRSSVIKRYFSTASISRIEPVLKTHFAVFCRRLQECREQKKPIPLSDAYRSLAVDVITDLSVPKSYNLLETEDFGAVHTKFIGNMTKFSLANRHLLYVNDILMATPRWVVGLQGPTPLAIFDELKRQEAQAVAVIENQGKPIGSKSFPVIMNEVYKSDLPPEEKVLRRLTDEIAILIGAGSETTGATMETITYHILANPPILKQLKEELENSFSSGEAVDDVLSYKVLEPLPYLNACVQEGLRLATGVSGRLPRINNFQPTTYTSSQTGKAYHIPKGTPMSMTIRELHYNPDLFPDPTKFDPVRWLGDERLKNEKWFAAFGRGSRSCVGLNLARAELLMVVGNLFGKFNVRLADGVDRSDIEMAHDCFAPFVKSDSKGLNVDVLE
ncbi:putative cytochrome P450 [Clohesyomyces aquaticus]|uniref:Putative cytochrome P450 n=1 Tax=Clohesyomyces aquaticus TaxID=1231657 RepID=A0A1Y1ZBD8_9PLEO|nr:putative cytochrome P450 [Clohesyomyces aquaticus]